MAENRTNRSLSKPLLGGGIALLMIVVLLLLLLKSCDTEEPLEPMIEKARSDLLGPGIELAEIVTVLDKPEAFVDFISDHIAYTSYQGHLQKPETVLKTRVANGVDRVLLLQALLKEKGLKTRTVAGLTWPTTPPEDNSYRPAPQSVDRLIERIGIGDEALGEGYARQWLLQTKALSKIRQEVAAQKAALDPILGTDVLSNEAIASPQNTDTWVWLVDEAGNTFDPNCSELKRPELSRPFAAGAPLSAISLFVEGRNGSRKTLLSWSGDPYGDTANLLFVPAVDTAKRLMGPLNPSDINLWQPIFQADGQVVEGKPFSLDGRVPPFQSVSDISEQDFANLEPPKVSGLSISSVDTADFPRVTLKVDLLADQAATLLPQHLDLTELGKPRVVRVESRYEPPVPLIVSADTSGSMAAFQGDKLLSSLGDKLID